GAPPSGSFGVSASGALRGSSFSPLPPGEGSGVTGDAGVPPSGGFGAASDASRQKPELQRGDGAGGSEDAGVPPSGGGATAGMAMPGDVRRLKPELQRLADGEGSKNYRTLRGVSRTLALLSARGRQAAAADDLLAVAQLAEWRELMEFLGRRAL